MTENLAGRGEGLAGLGEARAALEFVDRLYSTKGGVINPEHYGLIANSNECGQMINAVRDAVKRLAALEAAAPAGTALPPDWLECKEFYDLMQCYRHTPIVKQDLVVENYEEVKHWLRKQVAALATPSPQAPAKCHRCGEVAEKDANERDFCRECDSCPECNQGLCSGTHTKRDLLLCGHERRFHYQRERRATGPSEEWGCMMCDMPAATQEQPAGSGGGNLSLCGVPMEIMGCFICQGEVKNWCPTHGNGAAAPGSPRKVGEDGAQTFEQWWASIHKFSTDSDRLDHTVLVLSAPFAARREAAELAWQAALARPSSAPVGEQKQEEGV